MAVPTKNFAAGLRIDASKMEHHCSIKGSGKVPLAVLYRPVQTIAKMVDRSIGIVGVSPLTSSRCSSSRRRSRAPPSPWTGYADAAHRGAPVRALAELRHDPCRRRRPRSAAPPRGHGSVERQEEKQPARPSVDPARQRGATRVAAARPQPQPGPACRSKWPRPRGLRLRSAETDFTGVRNWPGPFRIQPFYIFFSRF